MKLLGQNISIYIGLRMYRTPYRFILTFIAKNTRNNGDESTKVKAARRNVL